MILLPLHLALSLVAALRVTGSSACPTPAQVEAELTKIPGAGSSNLLTAVLDRIETGQRIVLRVQLYDARGIFQGERQLPVGADCQALAVAVATVLRGLELDFGELLPPLHVPPAPEPAPPPADRRVNFEVGGAFTGIADLGLGLTLGGRLLGSIGGGDFPLRAQLELEGQGPRDIVVGLAKHGQWWRLWGAPGAQLILLRRPFLLALEAGVPLGIVRARGLDFQTNQAGTQLDVAVSGGVRAGFRLARGSKYWIWFDARVLWWPISHPLEGGALAPATPLPQWEGTLGLGLSWYQR